MLTVAAVRWRFPAPAAVSPGVVVFLSGFLPQGEPGFIF